ncbi:RnfABCDGE type electron transport complex subunit G [Pseudomonas sp. NPDC089534]|uniref:RnfABCDGE type electron transport complex subunit G n=1 Tax=Pseudomonas sp. NPDC089534 TaxID=3364468 RepID=UPI003802956A
MSRAGSLIALALLAGAGIGATWLLQDLSAPHIAAERKRIESRTLLDMLAADSYDNQPLEQPLPLTASTLNHSTLMGAYRATRDGRPVAILLRSQAPGYAGQIEWLIAIDPLGKLIGVKTLRQTETPALGGLIGDWPNAWLQTFTGKSVNEPEDAGWGLKKDRGQFDQIAGATVTSRAAVNAIHDALRYFDEHRAILLGNAE